MAKTDKPIDQTTIDLLNEVTKQIKDQNEQIAQNNFFNGLGAKSNQMGSTGGGYTISSSTGVQSFQTTGITNIQLINTSPAYTVTTSGPFDPVIEPSPYIDMENEIYKNEFEEFGGATVINENKEVIVSVGLIDSVSEYEDDLYAKFPDGEIVPFNGHIEKFSVEMYTRNDFHRSDLIGSEVKKVAICHVMINDRLARIIEGTDIQDLLIKIDRAIEELKVMPFSICRDGINLLFREIYYNNQPAIIENIDEINNLLHIIPDTEFIENFTPPPYVVENNESEEWIEAFGAGMMVHDYDEKIYWWRNTADTSTNEFKELHPQPTPVPAPTQVPFQVPVPGTYPVPPWPGTVVYPQIAPWTWTTPATQIIYSQDSGTAVNFSTTNDTIGDAIVYSGNDTIKDAFSVINNSVAKDVYSSHFRAKNNNSNYHKPSKATEKFVQNFRNNVEKLKKEKQNKMENEKNDKDL